MKKLHTINMKVTIFASKDSAWDVLVNQFGNVNNFNPLIDESHALTDNQGEVGCERHCTIDSKNSVKERISAIRGKESFDIDIFEGGLPMMDEMKASISLKEVSINKTEVSMDLYYNTKPAVMAPLMKAMMKKEFGKMLIGLKYHLETGDLVTKGKIKQIMQGYEVIGPEASFEVYTNAPTLA